MNKLIELVPLFQGSPLKVWNPLSIDYYLNKIHNNEYFSLVRFNLDAFMLIRGAYWSMGFKDWPNNINYEVLKTLSEHMEKELNVRNEKRNMDYKITAKNFEGILNLMVNHKPENFYLAVSDRTYYYGKFPPPNGKMWVANLIKKIIPNNEHPFNSLNWKSWAVSGQIHKLFTQFPKDKIVVVGPPHFSTIDKKTGNDNITHLKIHPTKASFDSEMIYDKMQQIHESYLKDYDRVIYICEGGAPVNWIIYRLHGMLKNAFMIDIGRALDVYYADDQIRKNTPWWQWGGWLNEGGKPSPNWIKNLNKK